MPKPAWSQKLDRQQARGDGYPNILRNQEFPIIPRIGLTCNITCLRTDEGFMYYYLIRNFVTGEILGDDLQDDEGTYD